MDWDLRGYFSEFGNPTYQAFKSDLAESLLLLAARAERLAEAPAVRDWERLILDYEQTEANFSHLSSYLQCLAAADATNDAYLKEEAAFAEFEARRAKLADALMRGLGAMSDARFRELAGRGRLAGAGYRLRLLREEAGRRMPAALEALAADLGVNGLSAWSRLYFAAMGSMKFRYVDPERGACVVPMSQLQSLLADPLRQRRLAASAGAAQTFGEHEQMYAAALNAIAGTRHTINRHRGIAEFLEPSLRQSRIRATTLEALMAAIDARLPFAREVFRFRAQALGIADPGYADLHAPLPAPQPLGPPWEAGAAMVSKAFGAVYPSLGAFFDELVGKRWVDHTARDNKRPGAFCTTSLVTRESRIFLTYRDTLADVVTLAHETGHAWHARLLKDTRALAADYPMTVAEAASTFAERILIEGLLQDPGVADSMKLVLLDAEVANMLSYLLDLPVRFRFERAVYQQRQHGTLTPAELRALMRDTQREVFGAALAEGREDPWFWASKLHFYINDVEFYNYPYIFGYLLSAAFVQLLREDSAGALNAFERFLALSGGMDCEELVAETIGGDAGDPQFWARQIDSLQVPFRRYRELLQGLAE